MIDFLEERISKTDGGLSRATTSFLDLGTGNGHFLFRLREGEGIDEDEEDVVEEGGMIGKGEGWAGRMLGVDYSLKSVDFAERIAVDKGFDTEEKEGKRVDFKHWDIMTQSPDGIVLDGEETKGWDVVLDKGTFDAISLSEEKDANGRRICEGYKKRVVPLIKDGGLLLITSCNWTEDELNGWFRGGELEVLERIKYRSFSFGGQKGQTISSVCYRKRGLP